MASTHRLSPSPSLALSCASPPKAKTSLFYLFIFTIIPFNRDELDRFIQAMIQIRKEIQLIEDGVYSKEDNPLKNAPHTQGFVYKAEWKHPYSRMEAAFPLKWIHERGKLWPNVGRIDGTFGDRNLICTLTK